MTYSNSIFNVKEESTTLIVHGLRQVESRASLLPYSFRDV